MVSYEEGLEKYCGKCKTLVPIEQFHKDASKKDGLRGHCNDCQKVISKQRYADYKLYAETECICKEYGCGGELYEHSCYCEEHFYRRTSYNNLKTYVFAEDLRQLAEKQNFTCPATGDKLIPGANMSLDHIKPVSKYPELRQSIANLQWLSNWANLAKRDLSMDEFIAECVKVSNRHN